MKIAGSFETKAGKAYVLHEFSNEPLNLWAKILGFDKTLVLQLGKESRALRLAKTRAYVIVDEVEDGTIVETWQIRNLRYYKGI